MKLPLYICLASLVFTSLQAHDSYEITLEIQQKRKTFEAHLEMSLSTAVAACDPAPSLGILFEPEEFPQWEERFLKAAPDLIGIAYAEGKLSPNSIKVSLTREDDIRIDFVLPYTSDEELTLSTPILGRFPPDGFGVRVSYRDNTGHWFPPFMMFVDKQTSALPPQ